MQTDASGLSTAAARPVDGSTVVTWGAHLSIHFQPVPDEVRRRAEWSLGGIVDRSLLRTLFELPSDVPIARDDLDAHHWRRLRQAPAGVCYVDRRHVVRLLVPALRLRRAVLRARPSVGALHRLSQLAPYMERILVSTRDRVGEPVLQEAERLGIGVDTVDGETVLAGAPFKPTRHSAAGWHFSEMVTDRWCAGG